MLQNVLDEDVEEWEVLFFDLLYDIIDKFMKFAFAILKWFVKAKILKSKYFCELDWILVVSFNFNESFVIWRRQQKPVLFGFIRDLKTSMLFIIQPVNMRSHGLGLLALTAGVSLHKLRDNLWNFYAIFTFFVIFFWLYLKMFLNFFYCIFFTFIVVNLLLLFINIQIWNEAPNSGNCLTFL